MEIKIKLIGISGTNGSGKDSLGQMLQEYHGWLFISVTEILRDELKKRGETIERKNLRKLSTEWHKKYGAGALTEMAVKKFKLTKGQYSGLVIASLRRSGEVNKLHMFGGKLVWVDADPKIRYERTSKRGRSAEDAKTFEEFIKEEKLEMLGSAGHTVKMVQVKELADVFLENNYKNIEDFNKYAKDALKKYL